MWIRDVAVGMVTGLWIKRAGVESLKEQRRFFIKPRRALGYFLILFIQYREPKIYVRYYNVWILDSAVGIATGQWIERAGLESLKEQRRFFITSRRAL